MDDFNETAAKINAMVASVGEKKERKPKDGVDDLIKAVFHTEPWVLVCVEWPPGPSGRYNEWFETKGD